MTALIVGFGIGLFLAAVIGGYQIRRTHATRALEALEDAIPEWVNRGAGVWPPVVVDIETFIEAIDVIRWELELGEK